MGSKAISEDRYARLAALRPARQAGGTARAPDSRNAAQRYTREEAPQGTASEIPEGAARLAEILGATVRTNKYGEHLGLRRWFAEPIGDAPEDGPLSAALLQLLGPAKSASPDAPAEAADPRNWLFLDTETTGTAGGSGTYAFLVGIAWWDAGGIEVEQLFLREPSEEHSLLLALAERMAERPVLVTFNGRTFDWPLLETRYLMTRAIRPPSPRAHFDFLHPARNLWRLRLGTARLAELERHVLGFHRGADVLSELIPALYYDFLRGGAPEALVPVFKHNQMDLRGLAGLATRVLKLLADPEAHGSDAFELLGVSQICEKRGDAGRARRFYARSIGLDEVQGRTDGRNPARGKNRELPESARRLAAKSLARLAKQSGDLALACQLWEQMLCTRSAPGADGNPHPIGDWRTGLDAAEQLAMHYERHARQPHRAAEIVRAAMAELRRANRLGLVAALPCQQARARLEHRLARLERKVARAAAPLIEGAHGR